MPVFQYGSNMGRKCLRGHVKVAWSVAISTLVFVVVIIHWITVTVWLLFLGGRTLVLEV